MRLMIIGWWLFCIILGILVVIGYVLNIIDLANMNAVLTGLGILRIIGIFFPPLGAILGWFW